MIKASIQNTERDKHRIILVARRKEKFFSLFSLHHMNDNPGGREIRRLLALSFLAGQHNWLALKLISTCVYFTFCVSHTQNHRMFLTLTCGLVKRLKRSKIKFIFICISIEWNQINLPLPLWQVDISRKKSLPFPGRTLNTWLNFLQLLLLYVYWDFNFYITVIFLTGLVSLIFIKTNEESL